VDFIHAMQHVSWQHPRGHVLQKDTATVLYTQHTTLCLSADSRAALVPQDRPLPCRCPRDSHAMQHDEIARRQAMSRHPPSASPL